MNFAHYRTASTAVIVLTEKNGRWQDKNSQCNSSFNLLLNFWLLPPSHTVARGAGFMTSLQVSLFVLSQWILSLARSLTRVRQICRAFKDSCMSTMFQHYERNYISVVFQFSLSNCFAESLAPYIWWLSRSKVKVLLQHRFSLFTVVFYSWTQWSKTSSSAWPITHFKFVQFLKTTSTYIMFSTFTQDQKAVIVSVSGIPSEQV